MEVHNQNTPEENKPDVQEERSEAGIDWAKIDPNSIPFEVLKRTDAYENILSESISRRKEIKALREQQLPEESEAKVAPDAPAGVDEFVKAITERFGQLEERLNQQISSVKQEKREAAQARIMAQFGLPDELAQFIGGETAEEMTRAAEILSKNLRSGPSGKLGTGNAGEDADPLEAMARRIRDRMQGNTSDDIFAPGVHRQSGGGTQAF